MKYFCNHSNGPTARSKSMDKRFYLTDKTKWVPGFRIMKFPRLKSSKIKMYESRIELKSWKENLNDWWWKKKTTVTCVCKVSPIRYLKFGRWNGSLALCLMKLIRKLIFLPADRVSESLFTKRLEQLAIKWKFSFGLCQTVWVYKSLFLIVIIYADLANQ